MPAQPQKLTKAHLKALVQGGDSFDVHFNPVSLVYTVENSVSQQSGDPKKKQYVAQFSGKLTMDLQFDTTGTGADVRIDTNRVARFMQATANAAVKAGNSSPSSSDNSNSNSPPKAPPVLSFQWGTYEFQGVMESFKETIDFFSADGVAMRALVSITLARQDKVFDDDAKFSQAQTGSVVPSGAGDSALSLATRGGDPGAARQLASDNGLESVRFTGGAQLQVNAGVQLNPPTAFVTSSSTGASAGAGFGLSAGISIGAQASAQGSGGGALFGAKASAGVAASQGAFAGLETGRATVSSTARLDPTQMLPATVSADVSTFAGASYSLGGSANNVGSAGLTSDVGVKFSFSDRLTFDSDD